MIKTPYKAMSGFIALGGFFFWWGYGAWLIRNRPDHAVPEQGLILARDFGGHGVQTIRFISQTDVLIYSTGIVAFFICLTIGLAMAAFQLLLSLLSWRPKPSSPKPARRRGLGKYLP